RYYRPAIVYHRGEELSTGSARSIPEVDVNALLAEGGALMERFGGHHQAAGFSIRSARLDELQRTLTAAAAALHDWSELTPALHAHFELPLDSPIPPPTVLGYVRQLEPCGERNRAPLFLARDVRVLSSRLVGSDRKHLQLTLDGSWRGGRRAIAFGLGGAIP